MNRSLRLRKRFRRASGGLGRTRASGTTSSNTHASQARCSTSTCRTGSSDQAGAEKDAHLLAQIGWRLTTPIGGLALRVSSEVDQ
eukprot:6491358-Amphidinium_carterae.5